MQVRIQNTIRFGEEMEIVDQYYQGEWKGKKQVFNISCIPMKKMKRLL